MLDHFNSVKIAVIGDVILDHYVEGKVSRISPEAPVPIVNYQKEYHRLGGAANVYLNLKELGVDVTLLSVIGEDDAGKEVVRFLDTDSKKNSLIITPKRKTIIKTRVTSLQQQLLRIDKEETHPVEIEFINELIKKIEKLDLDGVIFSDYNKGIFYKESFEIFNDYAQKKKLFTVLDPKPKTKDNFYHHVSVMTPNHHEAAKLVNTEVTNKKEDIIKIGKKIISQYHLKHLLITRGEKGAILFDKENIHSISSIARSVFDVSGAGDTIIATFTACYLNGLSLKKSAEIANVAASEVITKFGTSSISFKELNRVLESLSVDTR